MPTGSAPATATEAFGPGPRAPVAIGVAGADAEDPPVVYSFEEVRAIGAPAVSDEALAALPLIGCDSEIALDFKVSLDASATVLPDLDRIAATIDKIATAIGALGSLAAVL